MTDTHFADQRQEMVTVIAVHAALISEHTGKQVLDDRVMEAMSTVARHAFIPVELRHLAYFDNPLPIGYDKTISQPFMVAFMTDLLDLKSDDIVLEIGTGMGYQAAVLGELARQVHSIEIVEELAREASKRLKRQGYTNIETRTGNGYHGWPEHAPFDAIMVTAAPDLVPPPLIAQLKPGGRMVVPAGNADAQQLMLVRKAADGRVEIEELLPVVFGAFVTDERY